MVRLTFIEVLPLANRTAGKQWHQPKTAFRPTAGLSSYEKRTRERRAQQEVRSKEKEMKEEKEAQRQVRVQWGRHPRSSLCKRIGRFVLTWNQRWIQGIKDKRAAKEEKERYDKMAEKMHRKRVERLKRREKRNKLLKS